MVIYTRDGFYWDDILGYMKVEPSSDKNHAKEGKCQGMLFL